MAIAQYVEIKGPDIQGGSQVANHQNQIEIQSSSMGGANSGGFHAGTPGGGTGTFTASDVVVCGHVGKQSTQILKACFNGTHVNTITIYSDISGGGAQAYTFLKITLTDCVIASYNVAASDSSAADAWYTETWSINYTACKCEYYQQDPKKGTVALANSVEFNMAQKQTVGA